MQFSSREKGDSVKIVIIGAGTSGIGAAYALVEANHSNWRIYDKDRVGGLSKSFVDKKGFTWDIGGHVHYSNNERYNSIFKDFFMENTNIRKREAYSYQSNRYIPYPFHLNLKYLPKRELWSCIKGLINKDSDVEISNFDEFLYSKFGKGIYDSFMGVYNRKIWADLTPEMGYYWIEKRIPDCNLEDILEGIILDNENNDWGPNNVFHYPKVGGNGRSIEYIAEKLDQNKIITNHEVIKVVTNNSELWFKNGMVEKYDILISTMPINELLVKSDLDSTLKSEASKLKYTSTHVFGIGVEDKLPENLINKCWVYTPEEHIPFYRTTILSNYSDYNTPNNRCYSLLFEVAESDSKKVNHEALKTEIISKATDLGFINNSNKIISRWDYIAKFGYPVPTIDRDNILEKLQTELTKKGIYSRGRFGSWMYEIGNQDHCFVQGYEVVRKILFNEDEKVWKI